ncbi:anti-virulence regulator CigR family protein [Pseudomonas sp. NPDC007930]|uniref:anti-virulence regulator CigR family protein n=1 Tax=Pseudomonas sp. NPDC007930 TaxID=3364417 RepID=UPI0036EF51C3
MKSVRSVIAGLSILMVAASPLVHAAPGPDDHGQGPQHAQGQGGHGPGNNNHGPSNGGGHGQRPPQDFGPVRNTISEHRADFGRGNPLPPNIHVAKGQPLPHGYGRPLDARARGHLPHYDGYEWRRLGTDVVLVAVGTGIVYEILNGVLN